jgi:tape measure domain-containing protein
MSAIEAAKAYVSVELRNNIDKGVRELQVRLKALSKSLTTIGASIVKVGGAITASFGGAIAALAFPVAIAAQIERTTVAFETLTNSADYAAVIINDLRQFAAKTPLQFPGLAGSTRLLLAYGIAAKDVVNDIKLLGEVAQGDQVRLDRLALAFGQVAAKGRLYATELRQFTESGFSPVQEIARTTNRDIGEILQAVSDGQITFADVRNSFITATSEGGRFYKSLIKQSLTLSGLFTTLKDNVLIAVQPFGDELLPVLKDVVREATKIVQSFGIWAKQNSDLIYSIGAITLAGVALGAVTLAIGAGIIAVGGTLAALNVIMEQTRSIWSTLFKSTNSNEAVVGMSAVEAKLAELNAATATTAVEVRANLSAVGFSFRDMKRNASKALKGMAKSAATMVTAVNASVGKAVATLEAHAARITKLSAEMAAGAALVTGASMGSVTGAVKKESDKVGKVVTQSAAKNTSMAAQAAVDASAIAVAIGAERIVEGVVTATGKSKKAVADAMGGLVPKPEVMLGGKADTSAINASVKSQLDVMRAQKAANEKLAQEKYKISQSDTRLRDLRNSEEFLAEAERKFAANRAKDLSKAENREGLRIAGERRKRAKDQVAEARRAYAATIPTVTTGKDAKKIMDAEFIDMEQSNQQLKRLLKEREEIRTKGTIPNILASPDVAKIGDKVKPKVRPKYNYGAELLRSTEKDILGELTPASVGPTITKVYNDLDNVKGPKPKPKAALVYGKSFADTLIDAAEKAADEKELASDIGKNLVPKKNKAVMVAQLVDPVSIFAPFKKLTDMFKNLVASVAKLGPALVAPFTAVLGPTLGVVAAVTAVAGAFTFLLNRAGLLKPMFTTIKDTFNQFLGIATKVFGGIQKAFAARDFSLAVKIMWAGIKVAFYTGMDNVISNLPTLFNNLLGAIYNLSEAVIKTIWDLVSIWPKVLKAAFMGQQTLNSVIGDVLVGNFKNGTIQKELKNASAELDSLVTEAGAKADTVQAERDRAAKLVSEEAAANQPASAEGVSPQRQQELAFLAQMEEADAAAADRVKTLQDEIRVLRVGELAARKMELADKGVAAVRLQSIALLERQKKALEIGKEIADRISTIDEEARVLRFGAAAAERFKLAQMGATAAQIAAVTAAQRQLTFLQEQSTLQDDITSLVAGEEAANRLRLQRQGLNAEEIAALEALQRRKTAIINEREALKQLTDEAKSIKDSLKSPLTLFREEQAKIIELQRQGLLTQAEASQAHTKSLLELKSASDLSRQPLGTALAGSSDAEATIAASRERAARLVAQARGAAIAQRTAAEEARQQGMGAARGSLSAADARQRKLERVQEDQLTALETIAANSSVPEPEVTII